jgi:hypothetical protein
MHHGTLTYLLENVLCCPQCRYTQLVPQTLSLFCPQCGWHSVLVDGDTVCFAEKIYETGQAKTVRVTQSSNIRQRLKWIHRKLVPWSERLIAERWYNSHEITLMREEELKGVYRLLSECLPDRQDVLLELGAGSQNHTELYQRFARFALSSDIYRDPIAVNLYNQTPSVFRCLMNVETLPIRDSSIDILFSSHVVEHFPQRINNLRTLHQAMKPGAVACHVVPITAGHLIVHFNHTISNVFALWPRLGRGIHGEYDSVWQELKQGTVKQWSRLFESCGFQMIGTAPGTMGLRPFIPTTTAIEWSKRLHIYGSWVFVMQAVK